MSNSSYENRSVRNYILAPMLQLKFGLYFIVLSALFVGGVTGLIYGRLNDIFQLVIELTDVPDEISLVIQGEIFSLQFYILIVSVLYFLLALTISVFLTHRMVGPTIAFQRHIRSLINGDFNAKTFLRKKDAFTEVADHLNELSDHLKSGK